VPICDTSNVNAAAAPMDVATEYTEQHRIPARRTALGWHIDGGGGLRGHPNGQGMSQQRRGKSQQSQRASEVFVFSECMKVFADF